MDMKKSFDKRLKRLDENKGLTFKGKMFKFKPENVKLAIGFLKQREEHLKNVNGYDNIAKKRYYKTLSKEFTYVQNMLVWFKKWKLMELKENKKLAEEVIKEIYDKIETGKLTSIGGNVLSPNTKKDYYSKVFKNGFLEYVGINEVAKKIILRKFNESAEVRFFSIETLKKLVNNLRYVDHKLMAWLMFDTGIEVDGILQLTKSDFSLEKSDESEDFYILHMRKEISKKSRQERNPYIYHDETNKLLKEYLPQLEDHDRLFNYKARNAYKVINETSVKNKLKLVTPDDYIKPKDFRSSCATHFLQLGWTTDEIKARLGHSPSSRVIDRYVSYLGLDQRHLRKKKEEIDLKTYKEKFERLAENARRKDDQINSLVSDMELFKQFLKNNPEVKKAMEKAIE